MSSLSNHVVNTKWHILVKIKVHIYYHDFHLSKHRIAEDLDMNHRVIQNILSKSVRHQINFRERNKIIDSDEMQKMIRKICENYTTRIFTWESLEVVCDVHVCARTIRKAMNETEFHKCKIYHHSFISAVEVIKRVFWVNTNHRDEQFIEYWYDWHFSDEMTLTTSMQAIKMMIHTMRDHHNSDCNFNQFRSDCTSFLCWDSIDWYWKSPLIFLKDHEIKEEFTQKNYAQQIIDSMMSFYFDKTMRLTNATSILYEDENSAHDLAETKPHNSFSEAKKRWNIIYITSSSSSLDFNVIENIWRIIKRSEIELKLMILESLFWLWKIEWSKQRSKTTMLQSIKCIAIELN